MQTQVLDYDNVFDAETQTDEDEELPDDEVP